MYIDLLHDTHSQIVRKLKKYKNYCIYYSFILYYPPTSSISIFNHEDLYLIELLHHSLHILNAFNKESLKLLLIDTWSHFEKFFFPFVTTTISIELSFHIYLALNRFFLQFFLEHCHKIQFFLENERVGIIILDKCIQNQITSSN